MKSDFLSVIMAVWLGCEGRKMEGGRAIVRAKNVEVNIIRLLAKKIIFASKRII